MTATKQETIILCPHQEPLAAFLITDLIYQKQLRHQPLLFSKDVQLMKLKPLQLVCDWPQWEDDRRTCF